MRNTAFLERIDATLSNNQPDCEKLGIVAEILRKDGFNDPFYPTIAEILDSKLSEPAQIQKIKSILEEKNLKRNQFKAAQKCYEIFTASTDADGQHPYLLKKNVPAIGLKTDNHGNLLIPVLNANGQLQSSQSIDANGVKRFFTGAKTKGGFYQIGQVKDGLPIRIAEGYAKGALSYHLTDESVFIAFSVQNMAIVADMVREKYPNHTIIINSDNDHSKQNNIGLTKATEIAKKINGLLCVPYCTGTDFNDVDSELGREEAKRQLSVLIPPAGDRAKYKWIDHEKHDVTYVNQRYMNVPPKEGRVNIYISEQGTGKTVGAVKYVKSLPALSVLYIAHLVTLVFQAARKFGIECYSEHKKLNEHDRLAICINSIIRLFDKTLERVSFFDVVVIDEIEQLLTRMVGTGKEAIQKKPFVFSTLQAILKNAVTASVLDADISPVTINFLQLVRPNERFNVIINEYQNSDITHYIYENELDIFNRTKTALVNNEPVLLLTNSLNKSNELDKLIECDNKIIVNSDTTSSKTVKEFVADVNGWIKKHSPKLAIFSPSVNTGFSIEGGHFKHNLAIFQAGINTAFDQVQHLMRDRDVKEKHVWIEDKKISKASPRYEKGHDFNMTVCNHLGYLVHSDPIYSQLVADVNKRDAEIMTNPKQSYIDTVKSKGHKIVFVKSETTPAQLEEHKEAKKVVREERKLEKAELLCNIEKPIESMAEYEEAAKSREPDASLKIERFEIEQAYSVQIEKSVTAICETDPTADPDTVKKDVLKQIILDDDGGKRREKARNLQLATCSYAGAVLMQAKAAKDKFKEDIDYILPKHLLLSQLLKAVGINPDLSLSKPMYTADDLREFFEWVEEERELIAAFWPNMPTKEAIEANPYRYVGTLLSTMGITQNRIVKKIDKKAACIGYKINEEDLARLHFFLLIKINAESVTGSDFMD